MEGLAAGLMGLRVSYFLQVRWSSEHHDQSSLSLHTFVRGHLEMRH